MSEMVERVAQAIALASNGGTWDDWYNDEQREFHRKRARAAIEAMREPTEDMWKAGLATGHVGGIGDNGGLEPNDFDPEEVWPAMIDAALADTKATKAA